MNVARVREFAVANECEYIFDEDTPLEVLDAHGEASVIFNRYELTTDEFELVLYYVDASDASTEPVLFGIISGAVAAELYDELESVAPGE